MSKTIDLPLDVMHKILEKCDYPVVQTFRKTNSVLRDLVAEVSPKSTITSITIESGIDSIQLFLTSGDPESLVLYPKGSKINIHYRSDKKGCWVVLEERNWKTSRKLLEGENFKKIFWQDFKILMDYHKDALLHSFQLKFSMVDITLNHKSQKKALKDHYSRFINDLRDCFVSRPGTSLKVRNFFMKTANDDSVLSILDHLNANHLKMINVSSVFCHPRLRGYITSGQPVWRNEKFRNSEQWQKAKRLIIDDFEMLDIEDVLHFEQVTGRLVSVLMEDLGRLINSIFTTTTNLRNKHYHIIGTAVFINTVKIRYGESHDNTWYFSTPDTDIVVELYMSPSSFHLTGMKARNVEQGREIQIWEDAADEDDDEEED